LFISNNLIIYIYGIMNKHTTTLATYIKKFEDFTSKNIEGKILYHSINGKQIQDLENRVKSVVENGLLTYDNTMSGEYGERGDIIWFASDYNTYGKDSNFVLSIEYTKENIEKYDMVFDGQYCSVHKNIPFSALDVVKIPVIITNKDKPTSNKFIIEMINKGWTPDVLYDVINSRKYKIFINLFEIYVQPYIKDNNFTTTLVEGINPSLIVETLGK